MNAYAQRLDDIAHHGLTISQILGQRVLQFFQSYRVFDQDSAPGLSDKIEKLTVELLTLPFSEQNHLWGVLRAAYHPSLLYKLRMVVFSDEHGIAAPLITETITTAGLRADT